MSAWLVQQGWSERGRRGGGWKEGGGVLAARLSLLLGLVCKSEHAAAVWCCLEVTCKQLFRATVAEGSRLTFASMPASVLLSSPQLPG